MKKDFVTLRKLADWVVDLGVMESHNYNFRDKKGNMRLKVYTSNHYVSLETPEYCVNIHDKSASIEHDINKDNDIVDVIEKFKAIDLAKLSRLVKYEMRDYKKNKIAIKKATIKAKIDELKNELTTLKGKL